MATDLPPPTTSTRIPYSVIEVFCAALKVDPHNVMSISMRHGSITAELDIPLNQAAFAALREEHPYLSMSGNSQSIRALVTWHIERP